MTRSFLFHWPYKNSYLFRFQRNRKYEQDYKVISDKSDFLGRYREHRSLSLSRLMLLTRRTSVVIAMIFRESESYSFPCGVRGGRRFTA